MNSRWMSGWRACLRLARRDALTHPGRSLLVVAMIALPVIGVAASDVVLRSHQLTAGEKAQRDLGTVADAQVNYLGGRVEQTPDGIGASVEGASGTNFGDRTDAATALKALLPAGSRVLEMRDTWTMLQSASDHTAPTTSVNVTIADANDPVVAGKFRTIAGRAAVAADEIELTASLARRLGVHLGDRVSSFQPYQALTVVGIFSVPLNALTDQAVAPLGSALDPALARSSSGVPLDAAATYLVKTPSPIRWSDVLRLNSLGFLVHSRYVYLHPPPSSQVSFRSFEQTMLSAQTATGLAVAAGMALLEIVLLAGPAFAVGARRQRRELAILAAVGGDRIDMRRTVLAQGVVLGVTGGVLGVGLGIAAGAGVRGFLAAHMGEIFGGLHLHLLDLAGIVLVGVATGLLAAMFPARSASRQDVVAALSGRRGTVRSSRLLPLFGLLAFGVGVGIASLGAIQARRATFILFGSAFAELGLVMCTPILVGAAGRAAPLFRGCVRLALRDAARNRGRSAPAAAAILAAAAGCVGVLIFLAGTAAHNRATYVPSTPIGTALVKLASHGADPTSAQADAVVQALRDSLPVKDAAVVNGAGGCGLENTCTEVRVAQPACMHAHHACLVGGGLQTGDVLVGGPQLLTAAIGYHAPKAEEMLREGGAVVFDPAQVIDGKTTLELRKLNMSPDGSVPSTHVSPSVTVTVPAAVAPPRGNRTPALLLSPQAASRLGLSVAPVAVVASTTTLPNKHTEDLARTAAQRAGGFGLGIERGYHDPQAGLKLALIAFAAFVIVGASGVATGLAIADGRADHATLAAVGAPPGVRRRLAATQSAVLAFIGVVAGTLAGLIPAAAVLHSHSIGRDPGYPLVFPWPALLTVILGAPLLGAAFAWLFTHSHLPLRRRAA